VRHFKSATEPKSLDVFAILEGHQGLEPFLLAQCSGPDPKKGRLSKPTEAEADQAVPDNLPADYLILDCFRPLPPRKQRLSGLYGVQGVR